MTTAGALFGEAGALEERVRQRARDLLPGRPEVRAVEELAPDVWRVEFADGRKLVAKHQLCGWFTGGAAHDLLTVEQRVLDLLAGTGCAVPRVLGVERQAQIIFLEYCGRRTLDDVVQDTSARRSYARRTVAGFCEIERVFQERQEELLVHISPQADVGHLEQAWRQASGRAREGLEHLLRFRRTGQSEGRELLDEILRRLGRRRPSLGSIDYNARNVVVDLDSGRLRFIEFAQIGWDWPERRLVQYTTSLGAGRPGGNFQGLLDAETAALYAELAGDPSGAGVLDCHHLVFHLNAAALLRAALETPGERDSRRLLQAWKNPRQRLERLAHILAQPLSADPLAGELREMFRRAADESDQ